MQSPRRDLAVGLFVLMGLGALGYLSLQVGGLRLDRAGGLELFATFDDIGGLSPRAPVVISGVKVGQVTRIDLDEDLRARVALDLDAGLQLPIDTAASIRTAGLLGDQFVAIDPGAEEEMLVSGESFDFTQSAVALDSLIGRVVHQTGLGDDE